MLQDFFAAIRIAIGDFYRQNNNFFWFFISVLISAAILVPLINTLRMGRIQKGRERYKLTPPDSDLKEHAVKSLIAALGIVTTEKDTDSLELFRKMLEERYPAVYQNLNWDVYGAGSLLYKWPSRTNEQGAPVIFCSHFDVTPKRQSESSKSKNEYIERSMICGPGALGGKCNVIAMLEAINQLILAGFAPTKRDLYFAFGHDGENGGQNGMFNITRILSRKGIKPAFVLYGSGNVLPFAISNRFIASSSINISENGKLRLKLVANKADQTTNEKEKSKKKNEVNDADSVLAEALSRVEAAPTKHRITDTVRFYYKTMAPAMNFWERFAVGNLPFTRGLFIRMFRNLPINNPMIKTLIEIQMGQGARKTKDGRAEAYLNISLLNGDSAGYMIDYIKDILSDLKVAVHEMELSEASAVSSIRCEAYKMIYRAIQKRFENIIIAPGVSNEANGARYFEKICSSVYRFSPVLIETKNMPNQITECIRDSSLGAAVETYISLIKSAGSESI
ncbi:MAG: M20/M25/M40 family metallo-hydrolase [Clostridiales bacterium]|nr:M20/M25/M40 family metallo-hydrolase [Clostridiales bacterium]